MKRHYRYVMNLCFVFIAAMLQSLYGQYPILSRTYEGKEIQYLGDKILIKFKEGTSRERMEQFAADFSAKLTRHHFGQWYSLDLPKNTDPYDLVPKMSKRLEATFVQLDQLLSLADDFTNQWGLNNTGQTINPPGGPITGTGDADTDALEAWSITQGSSAIRIGIVDTGIDSMHLDFTVGGQLASNFLILPGSNIHSGDPNKPWDRDGHGTRMTGNMAALHTGNIGIRGMAPKCTFLPIRVHISSAPIAEGTAFAAQNSAKVINASWGITDGSFDQMIADATDIALANDALVVACGGNGTGAIWFPGNWSDERTNILTVTASDQNDNKAMPTTSGPEIWVASPGLYTYTTFLSFPGFPSWDWLSSASCSEATAFTSGVAGLIRSLNSNLTAEQTRSVLQNTADKVGGYNYSWNSAMPGHSQELGYGRINAYQALLLTHAYSNKSMSASATAANSGRKIAKTSDGKWHVVYESGITSGGAALHEIFYRNSSDGQNWSTPQRLSSGNEQNRYPCIAANGTKLYVVWQRKNDSTHDVHFSSSQNSGASWSSYVLGQTNLTLDPLPVIQTGVTSNFSVMAIYRSNSGGSTRLVARRTTSTNPALGNWSTETTVPGTGANDFSPALASAQNYWGSDANFGVAYATNSGQIHYRYYQHATGGWSTTQFNLSSIVPGSNLTHKEPSLTGVGTGSTNFHVAWHRVTGSGSSPYDHAIIHRRSTGFDSWPNEYFVTYYEQQQLPALTALASNKVDLVFSPTGSNQVYKQRFNGTSWTSPTFVAAGQYPSISTGNATAKYVWTGGSTAPYSV